MYCPKCGAMMDGDTCAFCGAKASSGGSSNAGQQNYGGYGGAPSNQYASAPRKQGGGGFYDYFVTNLVLTILMCLGGPQGILPLIGLIFSIGSRSARDRGDWATARSKAGVAKVMFWITIVLFVLIIVGLAVYLANMDPEELQRRHSTRY